MPKKPIRLCGMHMPYIGFVMMCLGYNNSLCFSIMFTFGAHFALNNQSDCTLVTMWSQIKIAQLT